MKKDPRAAVPVRRSVYFAVKQKKKKKIPNVPDKASKLQGRIGFQKVCVR